jgi:hypothetical protein
MIRITKLLSISYQGRVLKKLNYNYITPQKIKSHPKSYRKKVCGPMTDTLGASYTCLMNVNTRKWCGGN